jgi:hypothetical protein
MTLRPRTVTLGVPPSHVFDYFATARNLVVANHRGPIVETSDPPTGPGSWVVLQFDQLRVRVDYEEWARPTRLAGRVRYSGFGSGNGVEPFEYSLDGSNDETVVRYVRGRARRGPFRFIGDLVERRYWRNVGERLQSRVTFVDAD